MSNEIRSNKTDETTNSVTIGDVSDGIHSSVVAGGDVSDVTINYITYEERPPFFVDVPTLPSQRLVGRDDLLTTLIAQLTAGQPIALSAEGLPGVGKTALAVALAHHRQVLAHFSDGVLWAGLGPRGDVTSALTTWATNLKIDVTHLASDQERKRAVQNAIGQRRLLIVMDDVWKPEAADLLRCGGPNCSHLLTTRDRRIARSFASAAGSQSVPPLEKVPAFKLLKSLAPEACAVDPRAALGLTQAVGGLPLALELLGGYLAAPEGNRFTNLSQQALAELADPKRRLRLAQRRLGGGGQIETLEEIIKLSLEGLQETEEGQAAVQAFYALGAFAPKPARFSVAAAEAVTRAWLFILGLLDSRNLVEVSVEGEISLHRYQRECYRFLPKPTRPNQQNNYPLKGEKCLTKMN